MLVHWLFTAIKPSLTSSNPTDMSNKISFQAKPMLNFQTDYDLATGEQVLTCFLLPQVEFLADKQGKLIAVENGITSSKIVTQSWCHKQILK